MNPGHKEKKIVYAYDFESAVDLTQELENDMPVYPGDPIPVFKRTKTISKNGVNLSDLNLGSHTGTHIDAPRHFFEEGTPLDKIPVSDFIGEAIVLDLSFKTVGEGISPEDLERALAKTSSSNLKVGDIVLCFTGCSRLWGRPEVNSNFTYLTAEGAKLLVSKMVRAVGIDFLSIEKFGSKTHDTHKELLGHGVFIVESLSKELERFLNQRILFMCFPIKFKDGDGAPCRAVAVPISQEGGRD